MKFTTCLFDLDGVIRHFPHDHQSRIEAQFNLADGALWDTAFEPTLIEQAVTGVLTRAQWTETIGERVGSPEAATTWLAERGAVDQRVLAAMGELRRNGMTVAILTNGTDTVEAEVVELGIADHVDHVFNTWRIGVAKPHPDAFRHVCSSLGVDPREVWFTDDSASKLVGAAEIGMTTHRYTGFDAMTSQLRAYELLGDTE